MKKSDQGRDGGLLSPLNSKRHWHNYVKTHPHVFVNNQIPQLLKEELISGMSIMIAFFFWLDLHWRRQILEVRKIEKVNPLALGW
jgi:hypothetical protein